MANWTRRIPAGTTNRRKWNLEDRSSLNNLKYHFAADGCSDVQYDLGKQLLENPSADEHTSHAQGVDWLLRAAKQGHEEAIDLLRECYKKKRGITEYNDMEVKACLSMTPGERAARKAARELFACLSNGGEYITPAQLEKKMREIYNIQKRKRRDESDVSKAEQIKDNAHVCPSPDLAHREINISGGNVITEATLVTAAVNYSRGRLPSVTEVLTLSVPHPNALDHVPCFHRVIFHPLVFSTLLYHRFINMISAFPETTANIKLLALFIVYILVSSENLALLLPMVVYYFSLSVMVWSTFKMLKTKHEFIDFRIWSGLFLRYGGDVDAGGSENQFLRNNIKPYFYFFFAFVINLITYPVISNGWIPHSEITVISFFLVFLTMIAFMYTSPRLFPDILILLSFGVNVLAKYPYEMDSVVTTGWRFLDLKFPTFCSFVIGNGIEFCLNCRAVLYLLIPGFLIQLTKRSNWHGVYTYLIPHCVTLSWLQISIISSQYATMFGLVRAALGLAGILLFLPLFGIITLMIPIFVTVEWLGLTDPKIRIMTCLLAATFALLGSCLMAINRKTRKYVTILQISICMVAAVLMILPYMTSNFSIGHSDSPGYDNLLKRKLVLVNPAGDSMGRTVSWDFFYRYCNQPAWEHVNKVETQLRCSRLEGSFVSWEGSVSTIQITKVSNFFSTFINNFPTWFGKLITCYYGEKNNMDCDNFDECDELKKIFEDSNQCNLNKWNIYEYEIKVRMNSGILSRPTEVYLKANHYFRNFTKSLTVSDRVWFKGRLLNKKKISDNQYDEMALGAGKPVVELIAVGCTTCHNKGLTPITITDEEKLAVSARVQDLMLGIKYMLNVLFNPLIIFK